VLRPAADLLGLVVPVACAGCGRDDVALCDACRAVWCGPGARVEHQAGRLDRLDGSPPLPVWAVAPYRGAARSTVVSWKDRGRTDLQPVLREAVGREAARRRLLFAPGPGTLLVVVPVPSSPEAVRRRGADLVRGLARRVARELGSPCVPVLRTRSRKRDQVGLGARERGRNLHDAVRADRGAVARLRRHGVPVLAVLVDDIVTTGATLASCEDVLALAGVTAVGALCLAATAPPGAASRAPGPQAG